jgi:Zn-dependent peptidase ImmA (M78 family)/transcriptional regulator with XRE-family HTH domain
MSPESIGRRVADSIAAGVTQNQVAARIRLAPEKFSRSINGKRAFSAVELAQLAEVLNVDVHWLITGEPDPYRLVAAARHNFDSETGQRTVPSQTRDEPTLNDVNLAYKQAFQSWNPAPANLPTEVAEVRTELGPDFVRPLADRIESRLDVDVIRLPKLSTAYSFNIGPRKVVIIPATGNWFHQNWSLAHELGHLVAQHHADNLSPADRDRHEAAANAFAADLLLPATQMQSLNWNTISPRELANRVWAFGVSTDTLSTRLQRLSVKPSEQVNALLKLNTQKLLRHHWTGQHANGIDEITYRMDQAASRRFPRRLQEAHIDLIAAGTIRKYTLAWMLGIDADMLEVEEPVPPAPTDTDALATALGHQH